MKSTEFVKRIANIAENYKTLYVMGCFGAPLTANNKERYCKNHSYNKSSERTVMIKAATTDTFGFDCVNLIKGVLWGWSGDKNDTYGGAKYETNDVPDINADDMIAKCPDASNGNWSTIEAGEVVWMTGHIGVYIGNGLVVECSPRWKNCVQVTALGNLGAKSGYNSRTWSKHGHLPYITYDSTISSDTITTPTKEERTSTQPKAYAESMKGSYAVTARSGLNVRASAGVGGKVMVTIPKGSTVENYGYYTKVNNVNWLYVQFSYKGTMYVGYCSSEYLSKK